MARDLATDQRARELLRRLVGFDTTSRNSNLALIEFAAAYLRDHGIASTLLRDESGAKANLHATIGPERDGGVVLSGHTDVVPVDGQDWHSAPFELLERDGRLYGRGTADMKSFIAVALAMVPAFLERKLTAPIYLAFSYDEEVGCLGVGSLVRHVGGLPVRPAAVIVGEPTEMRVVNAHKGICVVETEVTGRESHSSAADGVNAVMAAASLVQHLAALAEEMKQRPPADPRLDPPYTTVQVGLIEGGTAINIVPRHCRFLWEYRAVPGTDQQELFERFDRHAREVVLPRMRAVFPEAQIRNRLVAQVAPLLPEDGSPAETLVLALAGRNRTHAVAYGTEGGLFQEAGIPTVVCGPGNIAQAHKPDEFIAWSDIESCIDFCYRLRDRLAESTG